MLEALLPQGRWAADALGRHSLRTCLIVTSVITAEAQLCVAAYRSSPSVPRRLDVSARVRVAPGKATRVSLRSAQRNT